MSRPIEITIDPDCCVGSTICRSLAPAVFELGPDGQARVRDPLGAELAAVLDAAEGCPTMAIRVRALDTGEVLFPTT